jgi:hypothetical protein
MREEEEDPEERAQTSRDPNSPERLLGVKIAHVPGPSKKQRVVLSFVCFDTLAPRGTVAVRVAASLSPSWTVRHGAPLPYDHAKYFFPDDVIDPARYVEG